MTEFGAVLCDLDGVIRFFDHAEVARLERAAGLRPGSTAEAAFAPAVAEPLVLGGLTRAQWREAIGAALAASVPEDTARALAELFTGTPQSADPEVVELLRRARESCPVLLVTNATVWLDEDLAALGLTGLADAVVNSSEVGSAKPDGLIYQIAAGRAEVAPERCLFVDDRAENVAAATALGMAGLHYRTPADLRAALAGRLPAPRPGRAAQEAAGRP
ncbi:HAD family hydrolase [Kitasatospora sp. DSM 101779]|uniref:HAD family hydrolase n=1 Tax=Kitasatospora sp. DSM 101779 TaxID=2853165 RepID=UPI0021D94D21|nr:HAD-IA family hydrolase [Kitasatospora sp. DSM 101779]MCU7821387.1 HAD-IA family hydrolase [Kitasatospora sp. DSM 101779]